MTSSYITHGNLELSSSKLQVTNSSVMGRGSFSRKTRQARRTSIVTRYTVITRVRIYIDARINFSGHQPTDRKAGVRPCSESLRSLLSIHSPNRTSWYKPEQTPDSVLGEVSSSMEECRPETVALFREWLMSPHERHH